MNIENYFRSLSLELTSLKNRVRNFIEDRHWQTDGEWKESVLRSVLKRNIPSDIIVGRGFIVTLDRVSTQIDILLYSSQAPVLFRDGDLVFIQPQAVRGIIEVKTKLNKDQLNESITKLKIMGDILPDKNKAFLSIFAYDTEITDPMNPLEILQDKIVSKKQLIHFLCLGDSSFIRYWECNPAIPGKAAYERWHSYHLREMAYGYFIHNVLLALSPEYINASQGTWFPERSKEISKVGEMLRTRGGDEPARLDFLNE